MPNSEAPHRKPMVGITTSSFAQYGEEPLQALEAAGYAWRINPHGRCLTEDETIEVLEGCVGVVAGVEPLTRRVFAALPQLKAVARCGTGTDNVDFEAATDLGIAVSNTPWGPTQATVEIVLGMILSVLRNISTMDRELRSGVWKKRMGWQLAGKRVGIVGLGKIGGTLAGMLTGLGCEVKYADPLATSQEYEQLSMDDLLGWADIVTLHCSDPKIGRPLIGQEELILMGEGSWLVNCARGSLVDEQALCERLKSGRLAGAALDVYQDEPYQGPLAELDNVVLTPHVGSYAREGRVSMEAEAVNNLIVALGAAK